MFADCTNKRIVVVNEPCLEPASIEALKEIAEGNGAWVPVKMKADAYMARTPLVITSNYPIWLHNPSTRDTLLNRMFSYLNIREAPFLKEITKNLHPALWYTAFQELGGFDALDDHDKFTIKN